MGGEGTYPVSNPAQQREADQARRAQAQARAPLIAKWDPNVPTGFIHVDDAIEYIRRRWGKALRAEHYEAFSRDKTGPRYVIFGDWPDKSRGERYYKFDDIDMWVYRTFTGVPAGWEDVRKLPEGQRSMVPRIELTDADRAGGRAVRRMLRDAEEQSDDGTRIEEDGRRRN